ncbi:MAG: hypothetical protein IIA00_05280 [Proteobacteria bacterium]|nr:hypothetical protein [Pseudomonadota bacterium]
MTNSGVGHAFPTYVTPRVEMRAVALDADGREAPATAVRHVIQRSVVHHGGRWVEEFDARMLPGETVAPALPWRGYARARLWLEVMPDDDDEPGLRCLAERHGAGLRRRAPHQPRRARQPFPSVRHRGRKALGAVNSKAPPGLAGSRLGASF